MNKRILFLVLVLSGVCVSAQSFHWVKGMGGSGADVGVSVATDMAGNVYTTGSYEGTADFDSGPGTFNLTSNATSDVYVSKLDANGNFVWAVSVGGSNTDYGYGIDVDASGNVLVTGVFYMTVDFDPGPGTNNLISAGGADCFILCLDASGGFLWARRFGSTGNDQGLDLTVDAQGNVYTTGIFDATVDFDPGPGIYNLTSPSWNVFVSKLDNSGNFIWAANIGGNGIENPSCIVVDPAGNVYTSGYFMGPAADFDPGPGTFTMSSGAAFTSNGFVSKLDAAGNFVWAMAYLGSGVCQVSGITINAAGDLALAGSYRGTIDFDPGAGTANSISLNNTYDGFVAKIDPAGNPYWTRFFGGAVGDDLAFQALTDASGNIHTTGRYSGLADFDPGAAVFSMAPNGNEDLYILELDGSGNFVNANSTGGTGFDSGSNMDMDGAGNIYLTGAFSGSTNFSPALSLTAIGTYDAFVLKFRSCNSLVILSPAGSTVQTGVSAQFAITAAGSPNSSLQWEADTGQGFSAISNGSLYAGVTTATLTVNTPSLSQNNNAFRCVVTDGNCLVTSSSAALSVYEDTGMDELSVQNGIRVFPNPATDELQFQIPPALNGSEYILSDQTGRQLLSGKISSVITTIDISLLAPGIYLLRTSQSLPVKIVKQ